MMPCPQGESGHGGEEAGPEGVRGQAWRGKGREKGGEDLPLEVREKGRLGLLEVMLFADQSVLLWLEYRRGKDLQEQDTHGSEVLGGG